LRVGKIHSVTTDAVWVALDCRWVPPTIIVADGSHQTAAQRGGEAKDKDKPLPDLQRDR